MSKGKKIAFVLAGLMTVFAVEQLGGIREWMNSSRQSIAEPDATPVFAPNVSADDPLMAKLRAEAPRLYRAPVDAKIDRVWKAIPGYNGMEVDFEATYRKAVASPKQPMQYVYRQIPPKVNLEQLGSHPIYRGNPEKPMVSLMINVAWGNEFIPPMLDTLDKERVKATFFLDGSWLKKNPDLAKEIQKRGHEMSNHAYSHPNMSRLSRERAIQEMEKTQVLLKDTLGVKNRWFAPPSGDFDQETVDLAAGLGMKTVLWTLDTVDWKHPSPVAVVRKIAKGVEAGSLILMHPTSSSSEALRDMILAIRDKGLVLGTVSQTLSPERLLPASVE